MALFRLGERYQLSRNEKNVIYARYTATVFVGYFFLIVSLCNEIEQKLSKPYTPIAAFSREENYEKKLLKLVCGLGRSGDE